MHAAAEKNTHLSYKTPTSETTGIFLPIRKLQGFGSRSEKVPYIKVEIATPQNSEENARRFFFFEVIVIDIYVYYINIIYIYYTYTYIYGSFNKDTNF